MEEMELTNNFREFFKGKTVLVTGHTGFKGSWLSIWLNDMGARVVGYALEPPYENSLFELSNLKDKIIDIRADVRDADKLNEVFKEYKPDIVIHLAAQSLVRLSYDEPIRTFSTNFMGSLNILECLRKNPVKSAVMITSDKCYKNIEQEKGYLEGDRMSDHDPYSCSKGVTEMVIECYRKSFDVKVASTRAGNVIGGGDWALDRIIPDVIRSIRKNEKTVIRSPESVRPWLFVLEPLFGYLLLAKKQYEGENLSGGWNFGPVKESIVPVKELVGMIMSNWGSGEIDIQRDSSNKHEAKLLYLDCTKSNTKIGWKPKLNIQNTAKYIVEWYKNFDKEDVHELCLKQIHNYESAN